MVALAVAAGLSAQAQAQAGGAAGDPAAPGSTDRNPTGGTESPGDAIVVTAQRRPVRAQDVPGAISVVTARELDATTTRTFEDLARIDPSTQLSAYQGEMQLFVRGVGAVTFIGGFDTSVGVYSDGVYLSRPAAIPPAFFDLERVEILKGPQGSLYGRNATGGAIQLVHRGPTADWQADASLTLGNYRTVDGFAAISGPLTDHLGMRLAVGTNNHSGYTRLDFGLQPSGERRIAHGEDRHDLTARLTLEWRPTESTGLEIVGDYYRADDRAVMFHFSGPGYANNPLFLARLAQGEVGGYGTRTVKTSFLPENDPEHWGVSARGWVDLPFGTLSALSAYRRTRPRNLDDLSNSTVLGESQFKEERARQFSQDLLLASRPGAPVSYVAGLSYFRERNAIRNEYVFPYLLDYLGGTGSADCCLLKANGTTRTDAFAAFADATVPLAARLDLVAGARWSHERRGGSNLLEFVSVQTVNAAVFDPATFEAFTPRFGLRLRPSDDVQLHATVSKGFKSGGFNTGSAQNDPYRPEKVWSYEIGGDWTVPAAGLRFKAAAFHYDYRDLQVQDVVANSVIIRNAATARIDGVELDARIDPVPALTLEAAGTYLDARFSRYDTVNLKQPELGVLDLSGNPLPQAPRFKGRVAGEYRTQLSPRYRLTLRADLLWQGRIYFSAFKDPRATQGAYAWLKTRATFATLDGRYELALFADNLTNVRAFTNISITGDLDASRGSGQLAPPRTFGARLSAHF